MSKDVITLCIYADARRQPLPGLYMSRHTGTPPTSTTNLLLELADGTYLQGAYIIYKEQADWYVLSVPIDSPIGYTLTRKPVVAYYQLPAKEQT